MPDPSRPQYPTPTGLVDILSAAGGGRSTSDPAGVSVTGLALNTERVRPGDLFAALPGARTHGARFVDQAVAAGAVAIITDEEGAAIAAGVLRPDDDPVGAVPVLVVPEPRRVLGRLAALIHGEPARDLTLVGVTGTQGKTTTTRLLDGALRAAGIRSATIGTVGTLIDGHEIGSELTTPEAPELHALFALMREQAVQVCAIEVSSHALVSGRVDGVVFDVAAFLNLGRDHLDFHHDMEEYFAAKASLLHPERARHGVVNIDDPYGRRLVAGAQIPITTFALADPSADWRVQDIRADATGTRFGIVAPTGEVIDVDLPLAGAFNVANALAAVVLAATVGLDAGAVAAGLRRTGGIPGRMERIELSAAPPHCVAVVDYAHKPDAVTAVLAGLRPLTGGRLIIVLGAGGDRDPGKRPLMGEAAASGADVVVITDDNPRSEDPAAIRAAVRSGAEPVARRAERRVEVHEIADRREAIRYAVSIAAPHDTVLVAGKGHETGQEFGAGTDRVVHPFDDRAELRAALVDASRAGAS